MKNDIPMYMVSSVSRSGSSMMMRCLEGGGLMVVVDPEQDTANILAPDNYIPNPNGFYQFSEEITSEFYEKYKGNLIKCPLRDLLKLPEGNYKLVFIKRDPKEIRASMARWTPYQSWGDEEVLTYFYDEYLDELFRRLKQRDDIDITILNYAEVVAEPITAFDTLVKRGWNINAVEAAKLVDPELHRLRLENL